MLFASVSPLAQLFLPVPLEVELGLASLLF